MHQIRSDSPLQRGLRLVLTLALVASLVMTSAFAVQSWQAIRPGSFADLMVNRSTDEVARHLALVGPRLAPDATIIARTEAELAATPRNWPLIESLMALLADRAPLPEALVAEVERLHAEDHGWDDTASQCLRCMWNLGNCALDAVSLSCAIPNVALPIGDVFELARAGTDYLRGEEVDTFGATLAAVGLGATVLVVVSGGSSASVKAGAGVLKLAHRTGSLPPRILATITEAARRGIDWAGLARVRHVDDLAGVLRADALAPAVQLAGDIGRMQESIGLDGGLRLLAKADDAADLGRLSRLTEALGPRTEALLELVGKSRLTRMLLRVSDEAVALIAGVLGMGAALLALLGQAGLSLSLRLAKRRMKRQAYQRRTEPSITARR